MFLAVIGARFLVPSLTPRFPLPAISACLVLDAADQSIFQLFGSAPRDTRPTTRLWTSTT